MFAIVEDFVATLPLGFLAARVGPKAGNDSEFQRVHSQLGMDGLCV